MEIESAMNGSSDMDCTMDEMDYPTGGIEDEDEIIIETTTTLRTEFKPLATKRNSQITKFFLI